MVVMLHVWHPGVRAFAREQGEASPMLSFMESLDAKGFRGGEAIEHDRVLADLNRGPVRKRR